MNPYHGGFLSEGEFKRRIQQGEFRWSDGFHIEVNAIDKHDMIKLVGEARREFPFYEKWILLHPEIKDPQKIIVGCLKSQEQWFIKWFGENKNEC